MNLEIKTFRINPINREPDAFQLDEKNYIENPKRKRNQSENLKTILADQKKGLIEIENTPRFQSFIESVNPAKELLNIKARQMVWDWDYKALKIIGEQKEKTILKTLMQDCEKTLIALEEAKAELTLSDEAFLYEAHYILGQEPDIKILVPVLSERTKDYVQKHGPRHLVPWN